MSFDLDIIRLVFFCISIVFIFEGILYALFPDYVKKMLNYIISLNSNSIRIIGFLFLLVGTITLYIIF